MEATTTDTDETHIATSLLIAYVIKPTEVLCHKIEEYAKSSSRPTELLASVMSRIKQHQERNPMLWFRLLRSIRTREYNIVSLGELKVVDLEACSTVLTELNKKVVMSSPFPDATWVMDENPLGEVKERKGTKKGVKTCLYGSLSLVGLATKAGQGNRAFTIINDEKIPNRILFTCTIPIK